MDNGKPIRESRDLDIRLSPAIFITMPVAQLLAQEFPGYVACGCRRTNYSVNFPLLMLAWKIAGFSDGKHVGAQARGVYALTALRCEICQKWLAAGVGDIVTGDGPLANAW